MDRAGGHRDDTHRDAGPAPQETPAPGPLSQDGPLGGGALLPGGLTSDGPDEQGPGAEQTTPEVEVELRPRGKFRIWQAAPIVVLAGLGSLMFAFPLAFGTGDGGSVIAMLGLLLGCCAAGWGMTTARKVGYTWPGLPAKSSGERADWRFVALYTAIAALVVALAVWRVARLR
ncbi:hypothetical protein [Streptomyces tremellae]|uniref:hypothetical protein n=1 Tax=Streptomyces tremellae TaxID=1124239 RepID=UPI003CD0633C